MKDLALIGYGYWGKNLAKNFYKIGVLSTICDSNFEALQASKQLYPDVDVTLDYQTILKNPNIRKIAIATPSCTHSEYIYRAFQHNKDVFVEKPFCLNYDEGKRLNIMAQQRNLILMVGHLFQYHPCMLKVRQIVKSRQIGNIKYITSERLNLGRFIEENALWSLAPHDFSMILSLCNNDMPTSITCSGGDYLFPGITDVCWTSMSFANGIKAYVHVSRLSPKRTRRLTVVGSEGTIVFDDVKCWEEKLVIYRKYVFNNGNNVAGNKLVPESVSVKAMEPLFCECDHFISCCKMRYKPDTDGEEALRVLKLLQDASSFL